VSSTECNDDDATTVLFGAQDSRRLLRSVTASIDNQLVSVKSPGFAEIDKPFSLFS
jgi:hypothetical protein